jgi:hypothetical protein
LPKILPEKMPNSDTRFVVSIGLLFAAFNMRANQMTRLSEEEAGASDRVLHYILEEVK